MLANIIFCTFDIRNRAEIKDFVYFEYNNIKNKERNFSKIILTNIFNKGKKRVLQ